MSSLRRALRALLRAPGFAVAAVVTLALAIASIGTLFAVVDAVLLKPLPFPDAARIVRIVRVQGACSDCPIARPALFDWQQQSAEAFDALGAFVQTNVTLSGDGVAERLTAYRVTPEFWRVLAVPPLIGRTFTADDDRDNRALAVISHGFWQKHFGADPTVVGKTVQLDGHAHDIVGVMPAYFTYPGADVLLPAQLGAATTGRDTNYLSVVARLRADTTLEQAGRVMSVITARQARDFPQEHAGLSAQVQPLQWRVTRAVKPALSVMFAASVLVLLVACANLANLMLARAQARRRELAVCAALGAGRMRLLWQLGAEAGVVAALGTAVGLALALLALRVLPRLAPDLLPDYNPLVLDAGVVGFVAAVALLALLAFGLVPAWSYARADPAAALQDEARAGAGGRSGARARAALVVVDVALTLVLLVGAALLIESSRRLSQVAPLVDIDHVITASLSLPATPNTAGETQEAWQERHFARTTPRIDLLLERLRAVPELESVAFTDAVPLSGRSNSNAAVSVVGRDYPGGEQAMPLTELRFVSADYFRALGLQVQRGRAFAATDSHGPGVATEVLVNDAFARTFLADVDPIGQQVNAYGDAPKTIVGVVASARQWGLAREPSPEVYLPIYDSFVTDLELVAKTRVPPAQAAEPLRRSLRDIAPDLPVRAVRTLHQVAHDGERMHGFFATLMTCFGGVALVLAMVGLYGLIAYSVARRRVEIGVRMSLGADRARVLHMILRQGLTLVGLGLVFGAAASLALSNVLAAQLYGVTPRDPVVLAAVGVLLLLIGAGASAVPAWRASRIAPVEALRRQ